MHLPVTSLLAAGSLLAHSVSCFNFDIHNQIGFMAENYLTPKSKWMAQRILESEYEGSIGRAASWADTVSKTTHRYSYTWHWISGQDDPPRYCNVFYNRDCTKDGCVVRQIANQTTILRNCLSRIRNGGDPDIDCRQAFKWILHFIGDVAQPMHTSAKALGGNLFKVRFNGTETNMHQVWDRLIVYSQTGSTGFSQTQIDPYFAKLVRYTHQDNFWIPRDQWQLGENPFKGIYWGQEWARDANELVCDFVYGRYVNGSDLLWDNNYARDTFPLIELQIAKAAWRLGGWLNGISATYLGASESAIPQDLVPQEL